MMKADFNLSADTLTSFTLIRFVYNRSEDRFTMSVKALEQRQYVEKRECNHGVLPR